MAVVNTIHAYRSQRTSHADSRYLNDIFYNEGVRAANIQSNKDQKEIDELPFKHLNVQQTNRKQSLDQIILDLDNRFKQQTNMLPRPAQNPLDDLLRPVDQSERNMQEA